MFRNEKQSLSIGRSVRCRHFCMLAPFLFFLQLHLGWGLELARIPFCHYKLCPPIGPLYSCYVVVLTTTLNVEWA